LYSEASTIKLLHLIKTALAPSGVAYVERGRRPSFVVVALPTTKHRQRHRFIAAKEYYFGVGGSVTFLERLIAQERDAAWRVSRVRTINDGLSNMRCIVRLER